MVKNFIRSLIRDSKLAQSAYNWVIGDSRIMLDKQCLEHIRELVMDTGDKYLLSKDLISVLQVQSDYQFNDIKKDDIVIDIGANIGGFCIPASRKSKYVHAIEPITISELQKNIAINGREITAWEVALGDGKVKEIVWGNQYRTMATLTLTEIKKLCDGCDFLKIDCEGAEWDIAPEDLEGIRRVEIEVHTISRWTPKRKVVERMSKRLEQAGFACDVEIIQNGYHVGAIGIIHAQRVK